MDGHHRLRIVEKHPEVTYSVIIRKNQLSRRNLAPEQRRFLIGTCFSPILIPETFCKIREILLNTAFSVADTGNTEYNGAVHFDNLTTPIKYSFQMTKGVFHSD